MKTAAQSLRAALAAILFASPAVAQMHNAVVIPSAPGAIAPLAVSPMSVHAAASVLGVTPTAVPAVLAAPVSAAGPIAASAPAPVLRGMEALPAVSVGRAFDGAVAKAAASSDEVEVPEDLPTDVSDAAAQMPELFVTRESKAGIRKGVLSAHVGLVKGKGSEWYWGKFKRGGLISLKSGTQTMFVTKVENAKTIQIGSMQRKDFIGLFTPQRIAGKTVYQLRRALVQDLKDRQERRPGAPTPVAMSSEIRLVRFMSSVKARALPENRDESVYPPLPRAAVVLPEALQGLNNLLPKTVLLDMRLFPDGVPYELIEDMSKLMKTGVYFVLLSDKPNSGPGSVEDLLTRQLSVKKRDAISRYKMVVLSDDGNSLSGYSGNFARALPSKRFSPQELEVVSFLASSLGRGVSVDARAARIDIALGKGADAASYREKFAAGLVGMHVPAGDWSWTTAESGGKTVITLRPRDLVSALPHLFEMLREHESLYTNASDMMVISRDAALLAATKGSVQPAALLGSDGVQLADESLAALLGPYRENKPGDLAASASKISSFLQNPNRGGGDFGNIYMMTGHIMHAAFNWAVWTYRNTGVLPTAEQTVQTARGIWETEARGSAKNLLGHPGDSLAGFYETVEQRLRAMHAIAADILKVYPIAVGTELPNMYVAERFKKGGIADHRDIFRLIFDFVVARQTVDGKLEIVVVDFKTGQVPTLQNLEKDTQVQLYDMLVRRMWKSLPLPYGGTGVRREVTDVKIDFLYTAGAYRPILNDWTRLKFDKFLKNVMNRIRKHNAPVVKKA